MTDTLTCSFSVLRAIGSTRRSPGKTKARNLTQNIVIEMKKNV